LIAVIGKLSRILFGFGLVLALGCGAASPPRDAPANGTARTADSLGRLPGTVRMADTLAAIYQAAWADPSRNAYLNRRRAELITADLPHIPPDRVPGVRYSLAQELLKGGQTREAIAQIKELMKAARIDSITLDSKPLFDLLAIAYLRLAEQENCLDNPAAEVCILPLKGAGRHMKEEGARAAIAQYEALLKRFPDDYGSRYLLNIAAMAVGGYPSLVPQRYLIPALGETKGSFPRFPNIAGEVGLAAKGLSGGVDVEDFNGDGFLDLFLTSFGINDPVRFFLADGKGGYVDQTDAAGLEGIVGGLNTLHADYDNDGDEDVFILRGAWLADAGAWPNSLLRNRGDGTFEDVTFASGLLSFHPTQAGSWGDFNLDGCLDLFIGNESSVNQSRTANSHRSELYVNHCDGTFSEISHQVGIDVDDFVKGVGWGDVNNDGLPDLYMSVMGRDRLYLNRGGTSRDQWRFEERAEQAGTLGPEFSFPVWFWDYDQDGWEDLLVLSFDLRHVNEAHDIMAREYLGLPLTIKHDGQAVPAERTRLYHNNGDGTFTDVAAKMGVDKVSFAMGSNFGDFDNDGWLDFYVGTGTPDLRAVIPNRAYRNVQGRRFEEVTLPGGFGHIQKGHGAAFADLDRDGDEDVYMVMGGAYEGDWFANALFENPGWPGRSWIGLELEGRTANRSAIGARVEVVAVEPSGKQRTLYRTVRTGGSFGSAPLALHIGLGPATRIEQVRVKWPDAARSTSSFSGLQVNRSYHVVQGQEPVLLERPPVPFHKVPVAPHPH
jgi:hypothetical protein